MRIECFVFTWNEERFINQYIDHYSSFADSITVLDNYSTDTTCELAKRRGCAVLNYGIDCLDNMELLRAKENCWKSSKADWVIVGDTDELLYHPNIRGLLETTEATVIKSVGYHMISETVQHYTKIRHGVRCDSTPTYDKCLCFRPNEITAMNWVPGCHSCTPGGNVRYLEKAVKLLHYSFIGKQEYKARYAAYRERRSKASTEAGHSTHYLQSDQQLDKQFDALYKRRVLVW